MVSLRSTTGEWLSSLRDGKVLRATCMGCGYAALGKSVRSVYRHTLRRPTGCWLVDHWGVPVGFSAECRSNREIVLHHVLDVGLDGGDFSGERKQKSRGQEPFLARKPGKCL